MSDQAAQQITAADLVRAGVDDGRRAATLVAQLDGWVGQPADFLQALGNAADPDQALLGLVRLREVAGEQEIAGIAEPAVRDRVIALLGASGALADQLVRHPEHWRTVADAHLIDGSAVLAAMREEVGDAAGEAAFDALRVAYRRELIRIATCDVTGDALELFPWIAESLADLAAAALQVAFDVAARENPDSAKVRLAVIGMGKTGGRELNYVSDVDVVFVAEPAPGVDEAEALEVGTRMATALMHLCSASTAEGTLWPVDAALRPEGKNGPLVRTVASHLRYYERWAKTWEFQALLKARPVAGDAELGQAYLEAITPLVWQASKRPDFVEEVQAMRKRVEDHVPHGEASRQLKLGPGGLRDVEFSMQLLQLVHGRTDEKLRVRGTLTAINALSRGGYIGRNDAHELDDDYRVLRVLEHRVQLARLKRTHLVPTSAGELRRLGRAMGHRSEPGEAVLKQWQDTARSVRRLHERIFYRPLLSAVARLDDDDARLSQEGARDRLAAIGYRDPAGAMRHLEALMSGVSRRAAIQRTLLPVMLQWFAQEADPDQGLLAFRRISESLGTSHWYLKMLRDEGSAAHTMAKVLAGSRFLGDLIERAPSAVQLFGDPDQWAPQEREPLLERMRAAARRQGADHDGAIEVIRSIRRHELIRLGIADVARSIDLVGLQRGLSTITGTTLDAVLEVASAKVAADQGHPLGVRLAVIGMGRLGGGEVSFASDADVIFVHEAVAGTEEQDAQAQAEAVITTLREFLGRAGPDPALPVDADLRPEGKSGPLTRTLASYRAYYERWSEGWEAQALLRAAPVAGDAELGDRFIELINPLRWPEGGIDEKALRHIRTLKARMEAERIPRGGDVKRHFKLGRGGLSDVEWTVQLAQLQHADRIPELRSTATLSTLQAMSDYGLISPDDAQALDQAWRLATQMRDASVLWRGRIIDSVPSALTDSNGIARLLGRPLGSGPALVENYLRTARRARAVMERQFYGAEPETSWDRNPSR